MTLPHEDTVNVRPTPRNEDWEAESDSTYPDKTSEGGVWYGKTDDEIVLIQIDEFNWDEHEEYHRRLDDLEGEDD
ncbi:MULTISPECIES: hypothetical protein [Pseudomonas]|uniref:hypothetical protein n=1 Tax=Pseudomonas TaxID=286 RepID=UPI000730D303|nr:MULTISPECIES: hypothetical protein [Pseudomonas]KTB69955.1 hypothetical protein AO068_15250 [Pseudomonas sp. ICMP 3272]KTC51789.1 hypothetical protein AO258_16040 [Pseudomonas syringae ICMP 19498]